MQNTMIKNICLGLLLLLVIPLQAQQKQVLSQYMFNGQVINPAYSGVHEKLSLTADVSPSEEAQKALPAS